MKTLGIPARLVDMCRLIFTKTKSLIIDGAKSESFQITKGSVNDELNGYMSTYGTIIIKTLQIVWYVKRSLQGFLKV